MESILKARKQLTVNDDDNITLESIINDEDFTFTLTKETFEQIISNHLESFTKNFLDFIKEYKEATEIEELLPNLPDISKWNINNVNNITKGNYSQLLKKWLESMMPNHNPKLQLI